MKNRKSVKWITFLKKSLYQLSVYGALIFLIIYLYRQELLFFPVIKSYTILITSIVLGAIAMFFHSGTWRALLSTSYFITYHQAYISTGSTIFTKYLPGKIWTLLGRASFAERHYNIPLKIGSIEGLNAQILSIWVAYLACLPFLVITFYGTPLIYSALIIIFIAITIILFHPYAKNLITKILSFISESLTDFPLLKVQNVLKPAIWNVLYWLFMGSGFWLLCWSLTGNISNMGTGFSFIIAMNVGVMAIFAPGGIGVRETVLFFFLSGSGFSLDEAITVSAASRLWFIIIEILTFSVATITYRIKNE